MSSLLTQIAVSQWHSASNCDSLTTPLASVLHVKCSPVRHTEGNIQYLTHSPLHYSDASGGRGTYSVKQRSAKAMTRLCTCCIENEYRLTIVGLGLVSVDN